MRSWIIGLLLILSISIQAQGEKELVILHVNDTHSRVEPIPDSAPDYPNQGGVVRGNAYVEEVRKENKNLLLLHCGDFVQGTPYFNVFRGEAEVDLMNFMKFDAAAIGNHEFDYGLTVLKQMIETAEFPILSTNLDMTESILSGMTHDYLILKRDGVKIGIMGLTPQLEGLVASYNYEGIIWLDPIEAVNNTAAYLKNEQKCDLVICLSHLGYYKNEEELGDITLAKQTRNVDIILGGHSHTNLKNPVYIQNLDGKEVVISQVGDRGVRFGRMDIRLQEKK